MNRRKFLFRLLGCAALSAELRVGQLPAAGTTAGPYLPHYVDLAARAGLTSPTIIRGSETKDFLLVTTGGGVALFDCDNDEWLDIFVVNGWGLTDFPSGQEPTNHLYKNNRDGTFTDVTAKAGLVRHGWGQGVCAGDYDDDGDLFVT